MRDCARACTPTRTTRSTVSTPASASAAAQASRSERDVAGLAETLLPLTRVRGAGLAPAIEELLGQRRATQMSGEQRPGRRRHR